VERRDGAEEEKQISEREAAEFPGIVVMLSPFGDLGHQNREWRAAGMSNLASARTRRHAGREQGLKILAREAKHIAVPKAPTSQAKLVMGLHDASSGACGDFRLCERDSFFSQNRSNRTVLTSSYLMCAAGIPQHIAPRFAPAISHAGRH
jgi:hypothetical protein